MPLIRRSTVAAAAMTALLVVSASACGPGDDEAASSSNSSAASTGQQAKDGIKLPDGVPTSLDDLKKWKEGGWKDWDKWARKASEFANPIIKNFWQPSRMAKAKDSSHTVST
ncbi:hypothetical protein ACWGK9_45840, partial [Streptomyces rubiginosohelvolus]